MGPLVLVVLAGELGHVEVAEAGHHPLGVVVLRRGLAGEEDRHERVAAEEHAGDPGVLQPGDDRRRVLVEAAAVAEDVADVGHHVEVALVDQGQELLGSHLVGAVGGLVPDEAEAAGLGGQGGIAGELGRAVVEAFVEVLGDHLVALRRGHRPGPHVGRPLLVLALGAVRGAEADDAARRELVGEGGGAVGPADDRERADLLGGGDGVGPRGDLVVVAAARGEQLPPHRSAVRLVHLVVGAHELVPVGGLLLGGDRVDAEVVDRLLDGGRGLGVVDGDDDLVRGDPRRGGALVVGPLGPQGHAVRRVDARHHDPPGVGVAVGCLGGVERLPRGHVVDRLVLALGFGAGVGGRSLLVLAVGVVVAEQPERGHAGDHHQHDGDGPVPREPAPRRTLLTTSVLGAGTVLAVVLRFPHRHIPSSRPPGGPEGCGGVAP